MMNSRLAHFGLLLTMSAIAIRGTVAKAAEVEGQGRSAPVRLTWSEGPEYPMGIQDSAFGVIDGIVVSAGGFTRHPKDVVRRYPDAFGGAKNGFTSLTFIFDPRTPGAGWTRIADIPGPARQAALSVVVDNALFAIGGFNYSEPYTYRSVFRLRRKNENWEWDDLHVDLPWPVCQGSAVCIGKKIYVLAAADYYTPDGASGRNMFSEAGRGGSPVGKALLVLDCDNLSAGWKRLADLPGVPRCYSSVGAARGKIYVLGGIYAPLRAGKSEGKSDLNVWFFNAGGDWCYDPTKDRWDPIPSTPDNANSRAVSVEDRFLLRLGGFKYARTWYDGGYSKSVYTPDELRATEQQRHVLATMAASSLIQADVSVFDAQTLQQATLAPMLDSSSWPMGAADGRTIYCLGGEGGHRLWHPATFQIGRLEPTGDLPSK